MNYFILIFSGIIIGLIVAAPIGPVNLICIRRTFAYGPVNGFLSGLGAALGDGVFAVITGFGFTASIGSHWDARFLFSFPLLSAGTVRAGQPFFNFGLTAQF